MEKKIKLFDPVVNHAEERAIRRILESHFWASGAGTGMVTKFENKFRDYVNSDACVAVNSGTAALHLALSLLDLKNKEVILPSLSFVATAHAVTYSGGKPVFVDVNPVTMCLDPKKIVESITRKTKLILPVHFAGMPSDLKEISNICKDSKITLIEDAAHAAGSSYKKKKIGSHATATCFSFHPVKNLAMPAGGAITLNGKDAMKHKQILKSLRWCGISNRVGIKYDVNRLGWNYYMNEFSAAIGIEQLKKLDRLNKIRRNIAKRYFNEINLDKKMPYNDECSYHFYWIQVKNRNGFIENMKKHRIEVGIHYKPIHQMKFYRNHSHKLPMTEEVGRTIVTLPTHPNLTNDDVTNIIQTINNVVD